MSTKSQLNKTIGQFSCIIYSCSNACWEVLYYAGTQHALQHATLILTLVEIHVRIIDVCVGLRAIVCNCFLLMFVKNELIVIILLDFLLQ